MTRVLKTDPIIEHFCQKLRKKSWENLDLDEQFFIYSHFKKYQGYKKGIAETLFPITHQRQFRTSENQQILDWYFSKMPLQIIQEAFKIGADWAIKHGKNPTGLAFFQLTVKYHRQNTEQKTAFLRVGGHSNQNTDDPYMYEAWLQHKEENRQFDLFLGGAPQ